EAPTSANESEVKSDFSTKDNAIYEFNEVIEDNDNYKFTLVDAKKSNDNDVREMKISFDFENKLDYTVQLTSTNLSMDGKMVDFMTYFFFEEVTAGKTATATIDVMEFDEYEYPEFKEEFEVEITISNNETGDQIGTHVVKGTIK
ncbi:MAG: hypothetical protein ABS882_11405, partial [Lysinibacillus sp.]